MIKSPGYSTDHWYWKYLTAGIDICLLARATSCWVVLEVFDTPDATWCCPSGRMHHPGHLPQSCTSSCCQRTRGDFWRLCLADWLVPVLSQMWRTAVMRHIRFKSPAENKGDSLSRYHTTSFFSPMCEKRKASISYQKYLWLLSQL